MKRIYSIIVLILMTLSVLCQEIPEDLTSYISELVTVSKYIDLGTPDWKANIPDMITKKQVMEDIDIVEYIFKDGYSGYDYWSMKDVDFDRIFLELRIKIDEMPDIFETWKFEEMLADSIRKSNINDGHLSISGYDENRFFSHKDAYFSEIVLEKKDSDYIVVDSAISGIRNGDKYEDDVKYLFRTLSSDRKENYIIGFLSEKNIVVKEIEFSSGKVNLPFHTSRITKSDLSQDIFSDRKVLNIPVLSVRSMSYDYDDKLKQFEKTGYKYKDDEVIILDIMKNGGGDSRYGMNFMKNLNGSAFWKRTTACLESPVTLQAWAVMDPAKYPTISDYIYQAREALEEHKKNPLRKFHIIDSKESDSTGNYRGRLYVLADRKVASSGEAMCSYALCAENTVLVGENTGGIGTFGEVDTYQLPNSKFYMNVPEKLFLNTRSVEGEGYLPDYWIDSERPLEELVNFIKFPESYQFRYSPDKIAELSDINMEKWEKDLPEKLSVITVNYSNDKNNIIRKYMEENKNTALEMYGDAETGHWRALYRRLPHSSDNLVINYKVKGIGLEAENNQNDECFVSVQYYDKYGNQKFIFNEYKGTFDWSSDKLKIEDPDGVFNASLLLYSSISGSLIIDDIEFIK